MTTVNIYLGERYYGSIRMKFHGKPFTMKEEEIHEEITRRLPLLKDKQFTIDYDKT